MSVISAVGRWGSRSWFQMRPKSCLRFSRSPEQSYAIPRRILSSAEFGFPASASETDVRPVCTRFSKAKPTQTRNQRWKSRYRRCLKSRCLRRKEQPIAPNRRAALQSGLAGNHAFLRLFAVLTLLHYRTPPWRGVLCTAPPTPHSENKPQRKLDLPVVESRASDLTE